MRERSILVTALPAALLVACALALAREPGYSAVAPEESWACTLSGAQALPPNSSLATGECDIHLRGDRIHVRLSWRDLSGPVTHVNFHGSAVAGDTGPVLWSLVPDVRGPQTPNPIEAEFEITHTQSDLLREGRVYVDIHTAVFPRGEIRGQLLRRAES